MVCEFLNPDLEARTRNRVEAVIYSCFQGIRGNLTSSLSNVNRWERDPAMGKPKANWSIQRVPPRLRCVTSCLSATVRNFPAAGRISGRMPPSHLDWANEKLDTRCSSEFS